MTKRASGLNLTLGVYICGVILHTVKLSAPMDNALGLNLITSDFYGTFFDDIDGPFVILIGGNTMVFFICTASLV